MKTFRHIPNTSVVIRFGRISLVAWLLTTALFFIVPQTARQVHAQEGYIIHVVAPGDNLTAIARSYNVSLSDLTTFNNINNPNVIRLGQQIRIPTTTVRPASTNTPEPANTPVPAAGNGGTSSTTAKPATPSAANSIPAAETATRTDVPTPGPIGGGITGVTKDGEPVYIVRWGDTLSGIASQFGVTTYSIMQRNGLTSPVIMVSQKLIIPISTTAPSRAIKTPTARPTATPTARATATTSARSTATRRPYSFFLATSTPTPRLR